MKAFHNNQGFTIIDVVMAMLIFSIGFASLGKIFTAGNLNSGIRSKEMEAVMLATIKLEEIMSKKSYSGYAAVNSTNYPMASEDIQENGSTIYSRSVSITEVSETDFSIISIGSGYKKVTVTVSWPGNGAGSGAGSQYLSTIFASY